MKIRGEEKEILNNEIYKPITSPDKVANLGDLGGSLVRFPSCPYPVFSLPIALFRGGFT